MFGFYLNPKFQSRFPLDFWILTMLDCTIGFDRKKRSWEEYRINYGRADILWERDRN